MKQFRVYLKSELGRLGNHGVASCFLRCMSPDLLSAIRMPVEPADLVNSFSAQEQVNRFVDSLANERLKALTRSCDLDWRENGVFEKLSRHPVWKEDRVPVDLIDVEQAEPDFAYKFERCQFQLKRIAADPEIWTKKPYSEWKLDARIEFPTCLGGLKSGRCKLFDGIHRAILMAKRGEDVIPVCFYEDHS
jgi:hypothetical protein